MRSVFAFLCAPIIYRINVWMYYSYMVTNPLNLLGLKRTEHPQCSIAQRDVQPVHPSTSGRDRKISPEWCTSERRDICVDRVSMTIFLLKLYESTLKLEA